MGDQSPSPDANVWLERLAGVAKQHIESDIRHSHVDAGNVIEIFNMRRTVEHIQFDTKCTVIGEITQLPSVDDGIL